MSLFAPTRLLSNTLTPFLYPCLDSTWTSGPRALHRASGKSRSSIIHRRCINNATASTEPEYPPIDVNQYDHLTPQPLEFTTNPFTDSCTLTLRAGAGGHGCISFLREKYIANGPADGGDGGTGGNVYIQAVNGETSLHKLARRPIMKAGRGKNGEGGSRGGKRGEDILIQVPIGTVIREISRYDPLDEYNTPEKQKRRGFGRDLKNEEGMQDDDQATDQTRKWRRDKWLLYPGTLPKSFTTADFPALPRPRRSNLVASQPEAPVRLDLDQPMQSPMLLAAGAMGGLGNTHFVTKSITRPKFATKGENGLEIQVQLELKLLADVGLVGLPNAGKSTLLRALTRSRTRIGDWAFTTLSPTVGTVVLDSYDGRARLASETKHNITSKQRTHFTIADIPGLIEDAHLDRGLGLGFLRHVERAAVLCFVVDLAAGDAVAALKSLWTEISEYENLREQELNSDTEGPVSQDGIVTFQPFASSISPGFDPEPVPKNSVLDPQKERKLPPLGLPSISAKPWFVVATKADLNETQVNFQKLQSYLHDVQSGIEEHPSGKKNAWRRRLDAVPVCALRKEGVDSIPSLVLGLLEG